MRKQPDNDVNVKGVQVQTTNQKRVEELLFEIERLEKRIQVYEKVFDAWDYLPNGSSLGSTRKKFSIKNKSDGHHYGYSFETWFEDARECTLRPILVVGISFWELVQFDVKQDNSMPIDNCSHCKDFGHVTSMCPKKIIYLNGNRRR